MAVFGYPAQFIVGSTTINFNPSANSEGYHINDISGLDGPTVRLDVDPIPQGDGAIKHRGFEDAIYFTVSGVMLYKTLTARQAAEDVLRAAYRQCLRTDGRFIWTPPGAGSDFNRTRFITVRQYEKITISGSIYKTFVLSFIAHQPIVYTYPQNTTSLPATVNNIGNYISWPVIRVSGATAFVLENTTLSTDQGRTMALEFVGTGTSGSNAMEIVMFDGTAYLNSSAGSGIFTGSNQNRFLIPPKIDYWWLLPGNNTITLSAGSGSMLWNYGWA